MPAATRLATKSSLASARSAAFAGDDSWRLAAAARAPVRHRPGRSGHPAGVRAAIFDALTDGVALAWSKVKGQEVLTRENIAEPMRDIRRALLEADVSLPVARRFVNSVSEKAVGSGVVKGIAPEQQLVKVVYDELKALMGGEVAEIKYNKSGPTVILMAGLQGVGKTTVCGKLAHYLKQKGRSAMLVATDVYRPAAIEQLIALGEQVGVPVFSMGQDERPAEIARKGLAQATRDNIDVVVVDTAGRLQVNKDMMEELKDIKAAVSPQEVLLVVDAMTGQEAASLVASFNTEIGITGAVLTKVDGDSRGGAALSVKEVSGRPIKFVGEGERMDQLEPFYPDRMAGRILGMGDVVTLVEKASAEMAAEEAAELERRMASAKLNFDDMLKQMRMVARVGSVGGVLKLIPGMPKLTSQQLRDAEKSLVELEAMINAMTPEERQEPELLASSPERRKRVADDSGRTQQQVNAVVGQIFAMRAQVQQVMAAKMKGGAGGGGPLDPSLLAPQMPDFDLGGPRKPTPGKAKRKKTKQSLLQEVQGFGTKK